MQSSLESEVNYESVCESSYSRSYLQIVRRSSIPTYQSIRRVNGGMSHQGIV
jgi:hypothetical protein